MATYVSTIQFTEKGFADIKQTCLRAEKFKSISQNMGVEVSELLWTQGDHDGILVFDAPNEEIAAALTLQLAAAGFVRPSTSRAYRAEEMQAILEKVS